MAKFGYASRTKDLPVHSGHIPHDRLELTGTPSAPEHFGTHEKAKAKEGFDQWN